MFVVTNLQILNRLDRIIILLEGLVGFGYDNAYPKICSCYIHPKQFCVFHDESTIKSELENK